MDRETPVQAVCSALFVVSPNIFDRLFFNLDWVALLVRSSSSSPPLTPEQTRDLARVCVWLFCSGCGVFALDPLIFNSNSNTAHVSTRWLQAGRRSSSCTACRFFARPEILGSPILRRISTISSHSYNSAGLAVSQTRAPPLVHVVNEDYQ